jgi:outer membrane protein assembly factor BamD (BamD/ComL family)
LNAEIKKLQEEKNILQDNVSTILSQKEAAEIQLLNRNTASGNFANAISVYLQGDYIQCAQLLTQLDSTSLDEKSLALYKSFSPKVNAEASRMLYAEGRSLYKSRNYSSAAEKLLLSYQYAHNQSFSDNCLFYLAYSEIKSGNKAASVEHMKKLLADYPSSSFRKYAQEFLDRYGK